MQSGDMEPKSNNRIVTSAAEIEHILNLARSHRWTFSYIVSSTRRQTSHTTELVSVKREAGTLVVGSEVKYSGLTTNTPVTFRAQSGGISMQFETHLIGVPGNELAKRLFIECQIRYPDKVSFTQMRKAMRVDCHDRDDMQVLLFADDKSLHGNVADISETGIKIRFEGNLSYQFKESRMVTDCQLRLPDNALLEARVKVLGFFYDRQTDISYLRCHFLELQDDRQIKLQQLVDTVCAELEPAELDRQAL